ncbi:hypothetical protein IQ235_02075 [Oscillatoriales cyanobacterium LEGE 11467]|uniref:Sulfotransferase family protein n=1 Tax=Zarconia navalis LEGE 11467 TaxID=1828826 RepID=A0A928VSR1_9CYAN|nr:hypothetical protein [Zarconia navalis]MBE9039582.1 hypothetical protein [Zarconia navalis LEGE 11467]
MINDIVKIQSSRYMNLPRKLSFSVHSLIAQKPELWWLYKPYLEWGQMKRKAIGIDPKEGLLLPDTELVIDGFQGSANSFATVAFKHFQSKPVRLMHHRHAPILIVQAIEQQVPVLLTIREPVGTVISLTSRWPHISVTQALKSYIGFYTTLKPYFSHCVVSTFEQTTQHLDRSIAAINNKFGTHFDLIDVDRANSECRKKISDSPERAAGRKFLKEHNHQQLRSHKNQFLLSKAISLYQEYETLSRSK